MQRRYFSLVRVPRTILGHKGVLLIANKARGNHLITTSIEHHAVLHTCSTWRVTVLGYIPAVDENGLVTAQRF
jgi:cysteine sulfinate desulfinase/cysteine desulfurase-like protein